MGNVSIKAHVQNGHLVRAYQQHRHQSLKLSDEARTSEEHKLAMASWGRTADLASEAGDRHGYHEGSAMAGAHYPRAHGSKRNEEGRLTSAERVQADQEIRDRDAEHEREQARESSPGADALTDMEAYRSVPDMARASGDESDSILHYLQGGYDSINSRLRDSEGERTDRHSKNLEAVINRSSPLPEDVMLHRNVTGSSRLFGPVGSSVGDTFVDHGFTSTTTSPDQAERSIAGGSDRAVIHIYAPSGTRGAKVEDGRTHFGTSEREILLQRRTRFRIHSDAIRPDGVREIEMSIDPGE